MILQKQLVKINNGVKKFQKHLTDVKPSPECKILVLDVKEPATRLLLSIT